MARPSKVDYKVKAVGSGDGKTFDEVFYEKCRETTLLIIAKTKCLGTDKK